MVRLISSTESQGGCLTDCFYNTDDDGNFDDVDGGDGEDVLGKTWVVPRAKQSGSAPKSQRIKVENET